MINKKRAQAADEAFPCGPKILVAGPTDSGKSSLAKMLLGWATKKQYKPMFVDLDPGQNSITIPGTLAATFVEEPVDPVNGIALKAPIAYFFGHTSPSGNPYLYKLLVREIANASISELRKERESEVRSSGVIVNTMGWVQDLGYELLLHTIKSFNVDVVLVLGQEELQKNLLDQFKGIDILYVPKSEGVVTRDKRLRHFTRTSKIKEYFCGVSNNLSPHQHSIKFNDIKIFEFSIPDGNDAIHPVPVMITRELVSSILAVTYARGPHQLLSSIIAGFIYVTNVDLRRCVNSIPSSIWIESL
ncbi:hypothetical protein KP509_20G052100 [Ceratopteris richardii]|uniref:Protein CLP1 homolog n=1 Tax=Ceratopteris richardii TaxID=49495 RepID=A0A8T2SIG6_CERRI|nr:hypothetical protein KP509_20G052100 [Ceratopteris richardii]